jgi:tetratricopeptide (TPR) repeat protein
MIRCVTSQLQLEALNSRLEDLLLNRRVSEGFALLDRVASRIEHLDPKNPSAISLVLSLAQWVDLGYGDLGILEAKAKRLPGVNPDMTFSDVMKIQLIQAFIHLANEDADRAIYLLERIASVGEGLLPVPLLFVAHFWKGRAHRKKGDYSSAGTHIRMAQGIAEKMGYEKLVAVTRIHESWLAFQAGEKSRAFKLLDDAERELRPVGHVLSLGNIESARGRFVRRSGNYAEALAHFEKAMSIYQDGFHNHVNMARAMVNAAYVKRLSALAIKPRLQGNQASGLVNSKYLKLTGEALSLLKRAGKIYEKHHHHGGTGSVLVNSGFLHLDSGDIERASGQADHALQLGHEKADIILMARAKNLASAVERARGEEQIDGEENAHLHLQLAVTFAEEAIELARSTENRRLQAEAYLARGFAALEGTDPDVQIVRFCAAQATNLLSDDDRDHLWSELRELKEMILRTVGIDDTLKRWSEGQLGDKSFQQVEEEFAEIVIPRVWENLGRSVSQVARQLSISPKKVRRLLKKVSGNEST